MTFEDALYAQLQSLPTWTPRQRILDTIIATNTNGDTPPVIVRLEQEVRRQWGFDAVEPIDWSMVGTEKIKAKSATAGTFDWSTILAFIEQILPMLLALLSSLLGGS